MVFRIDSPDNVSSIPTPLANGTPGYYANVFPGTTVSGDWLNSVQEELVTVGTYSGQSTSKTNNGQVLKSLLSTFAQSRGTFYTTNSDEPAYNSWICPANTYLACVEVLGGGGGGGAATAASSEYPNGTSGAGGGAGGYIKAFVKVTPGYTYYIVSGNGGQPGNATYSPGFAGGFSSFSAPDGTATLVAYGGGNPPTGYDAGGGGSVVVTGNAVSLLVEVIGGDGGQGNQYSIQYGGGNGGASVYGSGGRAGVLNAADGGNTWGAGGGGSFGGYEYDGTYTVGGVGSSGIVVIQY